MQVTHWKICRNFSSLGLIFLLPLLPPFSENPCKQGDLQVVAAQSFMYEKHLLPPLFLLFVYPRSGTSHTQSVYLWVSFYHCHHTSWQIRLHISFTMTVYSDCSNSTELRFQQDGTKVSPRWNFCFPLMELLFFPDGTKVPTNWNLLKLLVLSCIQPDELY